MVRKWKPHDIKSSPVWFLSKINLWCLFYLACKHAAAHRPERRSLLTNADGAAGGEETLTAMLRRVLGDRRSGKGAGYLCWTGALTWTAVGWWIYTNTHRQRAGLTETEPLHAAGRLPFCFVTLKAHLGATATFKSCDRNTCSQQGGTPSRKTSCFWPGDSARGSSAVWVESRLAPPSPEGSQSQGKKSVEEEPSLTDPHRSCPEELV